MCLADSFFPIPVGFLENLRSLGATLGDFLGEFWPIVVPVVLGMVAVYLLLPRVGNYAPLWGALLGGLALVFGGWYLIRAEAELAETILFYSFSGIAILSGGLLITHSNPARAALSFALVVLATCGLFLLQAAPFLMAATAIIYAGAIVVTFLFVLMLAQQAGASDADQRSREPLLASIAGFVLLGALLCVLQRNYDTGSLEILDSLDPFLAKATKASQANSVQAMRNVLGDDDKYFLDFLIELKNIREASAVAKHAVDRTRLYAAIVDTQQVLISKNTSLTAKKAHFADLARTGERLRYAHGSLQYPAELPAAKKKHHPVSSYSGTPANVPPKFLPADKQGKGALPAQNVASLGQALFTDYVLAVELAGTLLLVATIGAIAISGRRAEGLK